MVAPAYSATRSQLAKASGLGQVSPIDGGERRRRAVGRRRRAPEKSGTRPAAEDGLALPTRADE